MKGKRLTATMLALLLVVSLLPMAAMADDLPDNTESQVPINQPIGTNSGIAVEITQSGSVQTNTGSVAENQGTVVNNNGTVAGNMDGGTVVNNNAGATVQFNNAGATVQNNNAGAAVENNKDGGIIEHNSGYVGEWRDDVHNFVANSGNKGTVKDNASTGKVNNLTDGKVLENSGTVSNDVGSTVVNNNAGGTGVNNKGGVVNNNGGTVVNNYGGTEENRNADGTVHNNGGTVVSNSGVVCNNTAGSVVKVNEVDGVVTNYSSGPEATTGPKVETNFGTVKYRDPGNGYTYTYYGIHYEVDGKNVYIDQSRNLDTVIFSGLNISRPGYKLVNCQAVEIFDNGFVDVTNNGGYTRKNDDGSVQSFELRAPIRLKLLWEKIVTAVAPAASNAPEAKPVKAAALPSTVAAEDVKVGTVVRVKGQLFRVIEMDDGSMTVVTMGKLSKKDMEDLMAFLAKYFTPEQLELLLGDPELISGALAEELFGGNTGHIVFKAARNLFA